MSARCVGAPATTRRSRSAPLAFEVFEHQSAAARPEALEGVRAELRREATSCGNATGFEPALVDGALHVRLTNAVATALRP
jgi:hypothetical protein